MGTHIIVGDQRELSDIHYLALYLDIVDEYSRRGSISEAYRSIAVVAPEIPWTLTLKS